MKKQLIIIFVSTLLIGLNSIQLQANPLDLTRVYYPENNKKTDTVTIKTSAVCKMCKERLEHDMSFEKGVKSVVLNMDTKELTVIYKTSKTNVNDLKIAVTKIGYDADELIADQKAHDKLPACCQKGVDPH